jgi:predicted DsbA family dithiol-disulfide isomerase
VIAEEAGLDGAAFKEALETRAYRHVQQEALRHAYEEAGITAVPTFTFVKHYMAKPSR